MQSNRISSIINVVEQQLNDSIISSGFKKRGVKITVEALEDVSVIELINMIRKWHYDLTYDSSRNCFNIKTTDLTIQKIKEELNAVR